MKTYNVQIVVFRTPLFDFLCGRKIADNSLVSAKTALTTGKLDWLKYEPCRSLCSM